MTGMLSGPSKVSYDLPLLAPAKVIELDLNLPICDVAGLKRYRSVYVLVRKGEHPIGVIALPVTSGSCLASDIRSKIIDKLSQFLLVHAVREALEHGPLPKRGIGVENLLTDFQQNSQPIQSLSPLITIAVCTRDRAESLGRCLKSLCELVYKPIEVLVIDNAPTSLHTKQLIESRFPSFRYEIEPRQGLDWARNHAINKASGEIIAFTDDDTIVDPLWATAIVRAFQDNPSAAAVTGLIIPHELETEAQIIFELFGGFGRGFQRKFYRLEEAGDAAEFHLAAGKFGAGANMAFRKSVFSSIGLFDPALDVGTPTDGGGDLEMFFRVLQERHALLYEPRAIVRHCHRQTYQQVKQQLGTWGTAVGSYLARCWLNYPKLRSSIFRFAIRWLVHGHLRPTLRSFLHPAPQPRDILVHMLAKSFTGFFRYRQSLSLIAEKDRLTGWRHSGGERCLSSKPHDRRKPRRRQLAHAIRVVDLAEETSSITDLKIFQYTKILLLLHDKALALVDIYNGCSSISRQQLLDVIAPAVGMKILEGYSRLSDEALRARFLTKLHSSIELEGKPQQDMDCPLTSIVIATLDRPGDLYECLASVLMHTNAELTEIVVVDNNPCSGLTRPIVEGFPGVVLVNEKRRGLSYARNAGIAASSGSIIIMTDDDVIVTKHWFSKITAPFSRSDVAAVTGNTLPHELRSEAQHLFESYGGLGRGFESFEVGPEWFSSIENHPLPVWRLGATANAAFRREVFLDHRIGLMDETLGPGTPTGVGEDAYLMYKIVKEGYVIAYEPDAYVFHKHRRTLAQLRRQIFNYSKGHVAYQLTTLLRDGDLRALSGLLHDLPKWHLRKIFRREASDLPLSLVIIEIVGNLLGPSCLLLSKLRVKIDGRSSPTGALSETSVSKAKGQRQISGLKGQ